MTTARDFLGALVGGGDERHVEKGLERIVVWAGRSPIATVRKDPENAAYAFCEYLASPAGLPSAMRVETWEGLKREFGRYHQRLNRKTVSLDEPAGHYRRVLWNKLTRLVRSDAAFERLARSLYRLAGVPTTRQDPALEDQDIAGQLPPIAAVLADVARAAEVAKTADVKQQLLRIFQLAGNEAMSALRLFSLVWGTITPEPCEPRPLLPAPDNPEEDVLADLETPRAHGDRRLDPPDRAAEQDEWEARVDPLAYGFLKALSADLKRVMGLRCQGLTFAKIGERLGMPLATAHARSEEFKKDFDSFAAAKQLNDEEEHSLAKRILEILCADDFPGFRGSP